MITNNIEKVLTDVRTFLFSKLLEQSRLVYFRAMTVFPPMYGTNASGIFTLPSYPLASDASLSRQSRLGYFGAMTVFPPMYGTNASGIFT
ncbi:hypothetical protein, partial [Lysinibacillus sp. 54212]|uniref:hypothetical protein n=1 Tax=Lysinibacillus sp. 54212 TaxID=3119829 RepID=UPI002FCB06DB